jgi:hypothetical protein
LSVFFTCLLVYLLVWSGHHYSIDGMLMFQSAKSMAFRHSFQMDPPLVWGSAAHHVSRYAIGLTAAYIPVLWLLRLTLFRSKPIVRNVPSQAGVHYNKELLDDPAYLYASLLHPLVTALTALLVYFFAARLGFAKKSSAAIALIYGLGSPALPYAKFDFSQPLCAFFLLGAFYGMIAASESGKERWLVLAGISSGLMALVRSEFLIFQFSLLLAGVFWLHAQDKLAGRGPQIRAGAVFACSALPLILLIFAVNRIRFGSWFFMGYSPSEFELNPLRFLVALAGNLVSPGRGILIFFPAAWFIFFCWPRVRKSKICVIMLASAGTGLLLYSLWRDWAAGESWGPRFLVPYLPLLAILGLAGFETVTILSGRIKSIAAISLAAMGVFFGLQGSLFNFLPYYNELFRSGVLPGSGDYNFVLRYSPLVGGWRELFSPLKYDIFWLRHPSGAKGFSLVILLLLAICLAALAVFWWKFFKRPAIARMSAGRGIHEE